MFGVRLVRRAVLAVGLLCTWPLAGCGEAAPRADPVKEARVVSEANAFCKRTLQSGSRRSEQQVTSAQTRIAAILSTLSKSAAYLPAGRDLNEAHVARRALMAKESERSRAGLSRSPDFKKRFHPLQLRIFDDELALGLTCAGEVARARNSVLRLRARAHS